MQNLKNPLPLIWLAALVISACQFTTSFTNREKDKDDAKKIGDEFYADLKANKTDAIYSLFGKQFYEITPKDSLTKILNYAAQEDGTVTFASIAKWATKVTTGTTNEAEFELLYNVMRSKHDSKEKLTLTKEADGSIKILGYHVSL